MRVVWTPRALRQLQKLPKAMQKRIVEKVRFFLDQPHPLKLAKPLTDSRLGSYRFRIGEYRVIVDVKHNELLILKVAKRDSVYD